ncbi:diguanylate cyclase domain-containing protein [Marinobacterium sediminicola]|uniref:Diguanylate cyclase (GGDEF) domain-containing protein n=1 Tax=Marinobacterium sediminicola TaxID=518898 RepID=A0ABY1S380_9GAMM|nr:diguanylate cyclase [Marinobacterium sediminicola]ULG68199.1 diguanylate cyclase [Marinobacterium sediminicola]SMR77726.1 diguanylate cyclase (GGDEF) domain-containing protein [Marinobacterium sediminicola]
MLSSSESSGFCLTEILDNLDCTELLHSLDGGVLLLDAECRIIFCNRWFSRHTGFAESSMLGQTLNQLFPGQLPAPLLDAIETACYQRMGRILSYQLHKRLLPLHRRTPSGELQPLRQSILIKPLSQSELTLVQCLDITNAVKREQHLRAGERILKLERRVLELIATGDSLDMALDEICSTVEQLIPHTATAVMLLDETRNLLTIKSAPSLPASFNGREKGLMLSGTPTTCTQAVQLRSLAVTPDVQQDDSWQYWSDTARELHIAACWAQPIIAAYDEVVGVFACYPQTPGSPSESDRQLLQRMAHLAAIALERHRRMERIRFLAMHDPLTGLPNRSLLNEHLGRNLRRAQREGQQFALMFIDLDGFKQINDQHGHDAGDDLLSVLAGRMTQQLRGTDTCARIGGDEFVVMLETVQNPESAGLVATKILRCLSTPVQRGQQTLQVSASIGIALYPHDGTSADALLTHADDAMYQAKANGKNCWSRVT